MTLKTSPGEMQSLTTLPELLALTFQGTSTPTTGTAACKAAAAQRLATNTHVTGCHVTGHLQASLGSFCQPGTVPGMMSSVPWPGTSVWAPRHPRSTGTTAAAPRARRLRVAAAAAVLSALCCPQFLHQSGQRVKPAQILPP